MKETIISHEITNAFLNSIGVPMVQIAVCLLLIDLGLIYYKNGQGKLLQLHKDNLSKVLETASETNVAISEVLSGAIKKPEADTADKKYFDSADIKQLFKIGDKTLYRWRKQATIPFTNMGGRLMYPKQAVLGILQQRLDNRYDPIHIKAHQRI